MPENKKKSKDDDSDTSDSGPEDVRSAKKQKVEKSKPEKSKARSSRQDDDEEPSWAIDKKRFVKVRDFKGKIFIDIREYYDKDDELLPGKKGISLSPAQWRKLLEVASEVDEAIKNK